MENIWQNFKNDFNSMTDEEVEEEIKDLQDTVDHALEWLDAAYSWKKAGKPRD